MAKAKELAEIEVRNEPLMPMSELAEEESEPIIAYLLVKSGADRTEQTLEYLKVHTGVREAGIVFGKWDLIARVVVPDMETLRAIVIKDVRSRAQQRTETLFVINPKDPSMFWQNEHHTTTNDQAMAYAFVRASFVGGETIIDALKQTGSPQLCEAACVFGSTDVIVKITGDTMQEITDFLHEELRTMKGVESTDTLIMQSGMKHYLNRDVAA